MTDKRAVVFGVLLLICISLSFSEAPSQNQPAAGANSRGQYLVEEVARCWECHTPMVGEGKWDRGRWLRGSALWFKPVQPMTDWAYSAPAIAGLRSYSGEQARAVLERGIGPNGLAIRLPMHTYRLSPDDSQAIIAYLRSIPASR